MKMWNRRNTIDHAQGGTSQWSNSSLKQKGCESRDVSSWSEGEADSFMAILLRPETRSQFRAFLRSEYSEENLDFWLECERYRNVKSSRRAKTAAKIFNTFLAERAPKEVNLDATTRYRTELGLSEPKESTFEEAQKHIFALMERDSFRRFMAEYRSST